MPETKTRWTQDELMALLKERFGDDPAKWAFRCPRCGDVATTEDFRQALLKHPRTESDGTPMVASSVLGQECIGRTLGAIDKSIPEGQYSGRGCDWCAYGLFRGPWIVVTPDGKEFGAFPVADAPVAADG